MKRNTFLISYIILALLAGNLGNPWSATILVMNFAARGFATLASLPVLASLILPFVLSYIASVRGKLYRTPQAILVAIDRISAEFVTVGDPLTFPSRISGFTFLTEGVMSTYLSILLSVVAIQGPLVLHVICLTLGTQVRTRFQYLTARLTREIVSDKESSCLKHSFN